MARRRFIIEDIHKAKVYKECKCKICGDEYYMEKMIYYCYLTEDERDMCLKCSLKIEKEQEEAAEEVRKAQEKAIEEYMENYKKYWNQFYGNRGQNG